MSQNTQFVIDGIVADHLTNELPTLARGTEQTLQLWFSPIPAQTANGYGEGGYGEGGYGGFVSSGADRHARILEYLHFANEATITTNYSSAGVPGFYEDLPTRADVDTLVVDVKAGADVTRATDFWAIILGGTDTTPPGHSAMRVELTVYVLADLAAYDTKQDVVDDLGAAVV